MYFSVFLNGFTRKVFGDVWGVLVGMYFPLYKTETLYFATGTGW